MKVTIPPQYQDDFNSALSVLAKYGPSEIFLFGSLSEGVSHKFSDIDIAVKGMSSDNFFLALGELQGVMNHPFDLVNLDFKDPFIDYLLQSGNLIHVA